jgi:DHA1 family tetracycline resistance protein-like MFS transporter
MPRAAGDPCPPVNAAAPAASGHALLFIFVTLLIDTIGLGIILPVLPKLIQELTGKGLDQAALYGGTLAFAYSFTQFVCGPILGNLSDRFGRRPVLFGSLFAFGLDYLVMGLAPNLWWLFIGRVIAGIAGASYTTGMAFIADVSPPARRAQNFGLVGMAFGLGFIIGPALGGVLGGLGPRVPFFASAGLAFANLAYGWIVLPESLAADRRRAFSWRRAHVLGALAGLRAYPGVLPLLSAIAFWALAHQALNNTWSYYTMLKFGWDERAVGASLAALGFVIALAQGGLTRLLIPRWGERNAATVGMLCVVVAYVVFATAPFGSAMYAGVAVYALGGLVMPSLQALMSRAVPLDAQGGLQGAVASTVGLAAIVGPPLMTGVFSFFARSDARWYFPGAPFVCAALLTLTAQFVLVSTRRR